MQGAPMGWEFEQYQRSEKLENSDKGVGQCD